MTRLRVDIAATLVVNVENAGDAEEVAQAVALEIGHTSLESWEITRTEVEE